MKKKGPSVSLKCGLFTGIALVLLFQLIILTLLFQTNFSNTSKEFVTVEISPGALGLLKSRDLEELLKLQHNRTLVDNVVSLPDQIKGTPSLHDYDVESLQRKLDARKANIQKQSMEDNDTEKAPRVTVTVVETKPSSDTVQSVQNQSKSNKKQSRSNPGVKQSQSVHNIIREVPRDKRVQKPTMLTNINHTRRNLLQKNISSKSQGGSKSNHTKRIIVPSSFDEGFEQLVRPELLKRESLTNKNIQGVPQPKFDDLKDKSDEEKRRVEKERMLDYWKKVLKMQEKNAEAPHHLPRKKTVVQTYEEKRNRERQKIRQAISKMSGVSTNYLSEVCKETSEPLVECNNRTARPLSQREEAGMHIMYSIRTTLSYHTERLPLMLETWLGMVDSRTVFIVSDGEDDALDETLENIGMHYINAHSGSTHNRTDLCCKAGVELELMFHPDNEGFDWFCHVDDDMYVHEEPLIKLLARFDPKTEPIYLGRSGSVWGEPRVVSNTSRIGRPGQKYHFAVGGMYCLSRAMLELAKPYLVGCEAFNKSCMLAQEPEDVTVGFIIGVVLKKQLSRTEMIYTHGLDLVSSAPSPSLAEQIAFSHGYGSLKPWNFFPNVVYVPDAIFNIDEDETQFRSIHCHLYPTLEWCEEQRRDVYQAKKEMEGKPKSRKDCYCEWQNLMCCQTYRESYAKLMEEKLASLKEKRKAATLKNKTVLDDEEKKDVVKDKV